MSSPAAASESATASSQPPLPTLFAYTQPRPVLHYQGAEALLFRTHYLFPAAVVSSREVEASQTTHASETDKGPSIPAALKYRSSKPYRHPTLDAKLTRHRILQEARILAKLRREGVDVPALYALDWSRSSEVQEGGRTGHGAVDPTAATASGGWMLMEWIEGETVRSVLDRELDTFLKTSPGNEVDEGTLWTLMHKIGRVVGRMHEVGVVHGDLTTSNLMVRSSVGAGGRGSVEEGGVVLVDFGLAAQSVQDDEDRAVDLYVLERAFGSTHPKTEGLFAEVLRAYGASYKAARTTLKKLEEVRMRGRKKIMIG